jgi:hypothetical protein
VKRTKLNILSFRRPPIILFSLLVQQYTTLKLTRKISYLSWQVHCTKSNQRRQYFDMPHTDNIPSHDSDVNFNAFKFNSIMPLSLVSRLSLTPKHPKRVYYGFDSTEVTPSIINSLITFLITSNLQKRTKIFPRCKCAYVHRHIVFFFSKSHNKSIKTNITYSLNGRSFSRPAVNQQKRKPKEK